MEVSELQQQIETHFAQDLTSCVVVNAELTIEVTSEKIHKVCETLRDQFHFEQLIDVCGVDYLHYGLSEWQTASATSTGFERGTQTQQDTNVKWNKPRFAVVYHLLSLKNNSRIRVRSFVEEDNLCIDSVVDIWASANWFERETFDMFGILLTIIPIYVVF